MNIFAGILIFYFSNELSEIIELSFYWALFHVLYGAVLKIHYNPVVINTKSGNPIFSYYLTRFIVGLISASATGIICFYIGNWIIS